MELTYITALLALIFGVLILWNRAYTGLLIGIWLLVYGIIGCLGGFLHK